MTTIDSLDLFFGSPLCCPGYSLLFVSDFSASLYCAFFTLICRLFFFFFPGCGSVFSTGADVFCTGILVSLLFPDYQPISLVLFFLCDLFPLLFASLSAYLLSYFATAYPASFSFLFFNSSPLLRRLSLSKGGSMRWLYFPGMLFFHGFIVIFLYTNGSIDALISDFTFFDPLQLMFFWFRFVFIFVSPSALYFLVSGLLLPRISLFDDSCLTRL